MGSLALNSELYIKEHLLQYVIFQLDQGYSYRAIKDALLNYGYKKKLVEQVINASKKQNYKTSTKIPGDIKELDTELYEYIKDMLIDFIKKERYVGYRKKDIIDALVNMGHNQKMINEAFSSIDKGEVIPFRKAPKFYFPAFSLWLISLLLSFLAFFFISYFTNATIVEVYKHMLPSVLTFTFVFVVMYVVAHKTIIRMIPLLSIMISIGVFFFLNYSGIFNPDANLSVILGLNILIALIFSTLISSLSFRNEVLIINNKMEEKVEDPRVELDQHLSKEKRNDVLMVDQDLEELNKLKRAVIIAPSKEEKIKLKAV